METSGDGRIDAVQSAQIEKLAAALVAAQGELTNPAKTKTVYAGQKKYSFAPLPEIIDAVRPVLTKHGLAVVQLVRERNLETRVIHTSGQWIGAAYTLPSLADSQAMGSAISYARRYCLCAILGIAGEDDEDGEAATEAERAEADARRKEAEGRLDALKGKGKVKSAYDGKVLAPGEAALPGERAAPAGKAESDTANGGSGEGASQTKEEERIAVRGTAPTVKDGEKSAARATPPRLRSPGGAVPTQNNGQGNDGLAHSTGSGLTGIAKSLAERMRRDGITPEALKAYYVGKGHFPDSVEPTVLPADYVARLTTTQNWKLAVAAIKGGK